MGNLLNVSFTNSLFNKALFKRSNACFQRCILKVAMIHPYPYKHFYHQTLLHTLCGTSMLHFMLTHVVVVMLS